MTKPRISDFYHINPEIPDFILSSLLVWNVRISRFIVQELDLEFHLTSHSCFGIPYIFCDRKKKKKKNEQTNTLYRVGRFLSGIAHFAHLAALTGRGMDCA